MEPARLCVDRRLGLVLRRGAQCMSNSIVLYEKAPVQ